MRTTVDVTDPVFRKMKATAARRQPQGVVLRAVEHEMAKNTVRLPLIRSKHPGTLNLTNAEIEDLLG